MLLNKIHDRKVVTGVHSAAALEPAKPLQDVPLHAGQSEGVLGSAATHDSQCNVRQIRDRKDHGCLQLPHTLILAFSPGGGATGGGPISQVPRSRGQPSGRSESFV